MRDEQSPFSASLIETMDGIESPPIAISTVGIQAEEALRRALGEGWAFQEPPQPSGIQSSNPFYFFPPPATGASGAAIPQPERQQLPQQSASFGMLDAIIEVPCVSGTGISLSLISLCLG